MLLKIFWIRALSIVVQGMILGNLVAGILIFIQSQTHLIPLNPEQYYLDHVPVSLPFMAFIGLNVGVFSLSMLSMLLPAAYASRIPVIKALKFA